MNTQSKIQWTTLTAEQFKFEKPGDEIQGRIWQTGMKYIKTDPVPYVQLILDDSQDVVEILLGTYALEKLYYSQQLKENRFLAIKYKGESQSIKNANNALKLFDYCLLDENGKPIIIRDEHCTGEVEADYNLDNPPKEKESKNGKSKSTKSTES